MIKQTLPEVGGKNLISQIVSSAHLRIIFISSPPKKITSVGKIVEKRQALGTVGGKVNWYSYY